MRRRLLVISKEPEFDGRSEVVLGQCEPFTSGWYLELIEDKEKREKLAFGTYSDLRKIQEACRSIDEIDKVRQRVIELKQFLLSAVTKTIPAVKDEHKPDPGEGTKVMESIKGPPIPTQSPGGLLNLEPSDGVLVATVVQPDRADDAAYLKNELLTLLECHPKAVVMDLGRVPNLSLVSFKELAGVHERFQESGTALALCNVPRDLKGQVNGTYSKAELRIFDTQASALEAMKE